MEIHRRRSIRLPGFDYSRAEAYFVTLVTYRRGHLFGAVAGEEMVFNQAGSVAREEWESLACRFAGLTLDEFEILPNHMHGIVWMPGIGVGARQDQEAGAEILPLASPGLMGPGKGRLGTVIGSYKSSVSRLVNSLRHKPGMPVWQRGYYEHIIRDDIDLDSTRFYIKDNLRKWSEDELYSCAGQGFPGRGGEEF